MIVVDTHVLIWWIENSPKLSRPALTAIRRENTVVIPAICSWEMAMLALRGRVPLARPVPEVLAAVLGEPGMTIQPLTPEIGYRAAQLSPHDPMDPADQLIAATALVLRAPLVTSDDRLRDLDGLRTIW